MKLVYVVLCTPNATGIAEVVGCSESYDGACAIAHEEEQALDWHWEDSYSIDAVTEQYDYEEGFIHITCTTVLP